MKSPTVDKKSKALSVIYFELFKSKAKLNKKVMTKVGQRRMLTFSAKMLTKI